MFKRRVRAHMVVTAIAAVLVASMMTPADALTNTAARGIQNCPTNSATISSACMSGALSDFNAARAKERLGKLVLPSNFRSLTVAEQILVLTNLDRRARGIAPFIGLNQTLDQVAARGSKGHTDPPFPSWTREGGSNWSSTYNAFWTEYLWMYQDGVGGVNMACTQSDTSGCWVHRANILRKYGAPRVMGVATYANGGDAALYLGSDTHDQTFVFLWSSEAKYFPGGRLP
jgi:hypothetical protein